MNDNIYLVFNNRCLENGRSISPFINPFSEFLLNACNGPGEVLDTGNGEVTKTDKTPKSLSFGLEERGQTRNKINKTCSMQVDTKASGKNYARKGNKGAAGDWWEGISFLL